MKRLIPIFGLIGLLVLSFFLGRWTKPEKPALPPQIVEKIDTVLLTEIRVDTITRIKTITEYLPVVDDVSDEPMDTIDYIFDNPVRDSVKVEIPINRYVAQKDSVYKVVAEGYAVDFKEITVYQKTKTITNTIEIKKPTRWGLGIHAGYGATLNNNTVKLSPYVGVGVSYNIITW